MPVDIQVEIKDEQVKALLARVSARMTDMTPAMNQIGQLMADSIGRNFTAQGRPTTWPKSKRAKEQGGKTLSDTGILRRSINRSSTKDSAIAGTNVPYATTHNFGAKKGSFGSAVATVRAHLRKGVKVAAHTRKVVLPWGDIPKREFLMLQKEDWPQIGNVLLRFVTDER